MESTEPVRVPGIEACCNAYDGAQYCAVESSADCHETSLDGPGFALPRGFSTVATEAIGSPRVLVERKEYCQLSTFNGKIESAARLTRRAAMSSPGRLVATVCAGGE